MAGPAYQVTSQVNVVNPGGEAPVAHRDYHLGFMSTQQSQAFTAHVHRLSPVMTLQGCRRALRHARGRFGAALSAHAERHASAL